MAFVIILLVLTIFSRVELMEGKTLPYPVTVVLSLNGFRWDIVDDKSLVNFQRLMKDGVYASHGMRSSYTTEEVPNLITLATGLHAESHGIVGTYMHDPILNRNFRPSTLDETWFRDFEPIWITNEKTSQSNSTDVSLKRQSAVVHWFASNIPYNGSYPWYYNKIQARKTPSKIRFKKIIDLLDINKPPNLIMCHFQELDRLRHRFEPNSSEIRSVQVKFDKMLGTFLDQLKTKGIFDQVNIIIVSDHGAGKLKTNGVIGLTDMLNSKWYSYITFGGSAGVWPKRRFKHRVYKQLRTLKHLKVYFKSQLPERLHFKHHRRIPPIIAIADKGWMLTKHGKKHHPKGTVCGYDNLNADMNALFIARGPAFKHGYKIDTFENIHIYELLCRILNITARPNNGSIKAVEDVLALASKEKKAKNTGYRVTSEQIIAVFVVPSAGIIFFLVCLVLLEKKKSKLEYIDAERLLYSPVDEEDENGTEHVAVNRRHGMSRGLSSVMLHPWINL